MSTLISYDRIILFFILQQLVSTRGFDSHQLWSQGDDFLLNNIDLNNFIFWWRIRLDWTVNLFELLEELVVKTICKNSTREC